MKQISRVLFIVLAIVFIFMTASIFMLFVTHNCCEPSACVPCMSMAKIQEVIRQLGSVLPITAMVICVLSLLQFAIDDFIKAQSRTNLVLLKTKLNN